MACYIYLHPDTWEKNLYKVGKANDVEQRHASLSTAYTVNISEVWYIYPKLTKDYSSGVLFFIEHTIHKYLKQFRKNPAREFFYILDINQFLAEIIHYITNLGIEVCATRDARDLAGLHDYSFQEEGIQMSQGSKGLTGIERGHPLSPTEHQIPIMQAITAWHASDKLSGKLILPPGIGKSYLAGFYLRGLPKETRVLVLVPYISIQEDFRIALEKTKVACNVDVIVYNTAREWLADPQYNIIIYDEAHHMCAKVNSKLLNLESSKKLFMTATERIYDNKECLDMEKPIFGDYIAKMPILDAIEKRLLLDYKIFLVNWKPGLKHMIQQLTEDYHRKKIIMFFNTVKSAIATCQDIKKLGFNVSAITSETMKGVERRIIIDKFTTDEFHILCNVYCIGEGTNIPCIDTVIFMEDRASNIGVIQNIGRGLRLYPGKDFCMVLLMTLE
jgi:superfamily II DNA or RNA helicase